MRRVESPIEVVREWQNAANERDVERLLAASDPEISISGPRGSGYGHGHALLSDWVSRAGLSLKTLRVFARGGAVVALQRGIWRDVESGEFLGESDLATRFVVEGGRVALLARYDGAEGLDLALEEAELGYEDEVG